MPIIKPTSLLLPSIYTNASTYAHHTELSISAVTFTHRYSGLARLTRRARQWACLSL